ncbi:MAG: hypothetical protein E7Z93_00450 [Cyanobacteria bacterium SIG32]|nr:hypothetical protein [Cyanobacteria bacterium SIG32]
MMENAELFATIDDATIESIVNENIKKYVSEELHSADERRIFANAMIILMCTLYADLNEKAKMRLLRFAKAEVLDELGKRVDCERMPKNFSISTERYKLAAPLSINVTVPKGSTVTPDGILIYETTEVGVIPAGKLYVDVPIKAQKGGSVYNNKVPGSINTQVSNVPYIASVENLETTYNGDDGEPYPYSEKHPDGDDGTGDNNYRERIRKAPAGFSTAGPEEAYEYFALSADANIEDVKVSSNQSAGRVDITVIVNNSKVPSEEILKKVITSCSQKNRRPMNDDVHAYGPAIREYDIEFKYYVTEDAEPETVLAIENKDGAIDQYIKWQSEKITRDINPDKLRAFLMNAGAKRVDIVKPVFTDLGLTGEVKSYSIADADNNVYYVSTEGEKNSNVPVNTIVYKDARLTSEIGKASEKQYTFLGEEIISPKGIGELAMFSGNLKVTHEVEEE